MHIISVFSDMWVILFCWLNHFLSGSFCLGYSQGLHGNGSSEFIQSGKCCMTEICHPPMLKDSCISCEADNLGSIRWFKDGRPLPLTSVSTDVNWYNNSDGTIINFHPETADTSYIGEYRCEVTNATTSFNKTFIIQLPIVPPFLDPPLECHIPDCTNQQQYPGENATFHCTFCAKEKTTELEFHWQFKADNNYWIYVFELNITGTTFTTDRESNASEDTCGSNCAGSYLIITNVTSEAYGLYRLVAHIPSTNQTSQTEDLMLSQSPLGPNITLTIIYVIAAFTIAVCFIALHWYRVHLEVKLFFKDRFGTVEEKGQRSHDAFIAYDSSSEEDRAFVLEFIRPKLMGSDYAVYVKDIDAIGGASFANEILEAVEVSLRCVLVISPTFMSSHLMGLQVNAALEQMTEQRTKIIPVLFGDLNRKKLRQVEGLSRLLSVLQCIHYKEGKTSKNKFIKRLLLRMPKRSRRTHNADILLNSSSDTTP